jgi:4-hydroxybenzoate polyprenyltransferase
MRYLVGFLPIGDLLDSSLFRACRLDAWLSWLIAFFTGAVAAFEKYQFPVPHLILPALVFCLMTASIFILNQYFDIENDRANRYKSNLPIAGGELSRREGLLLSVSFLVSSAVLSVFVGPIFPFLMLTYFLLWLAYSHPKIHLKSRPVIDLIVAGIGAGLMPFLAGWNAFLSSSSFPITLALTFLLAQAGGHTLHTVGDREADILVGMNTSAVRFGERVVSRCGLAFFLFSLVLFIASVSKREIPLLVAVIPIVILPVASHTICRYIALIRKGADTPSSFEEIRKATVRVQICFLAAYALAFLFIAAVHPSLGH